MKCELCGTDPATLHVTELRAGRAVERHYCKACGDRAEGLAAKVALSPDLLKSCDLCGGATYVWFKQRADDGTVAERRLCKACAEKEGRSDWTPVHGRPDDLVLVPRRRAAS